MLQIMAKLLRVMWFKVSAAMAKLSACIAASHSSQMLGYVSQWWGAGEKRMILIELAPHTLARNYVTTVMSWPMQLSLVESMSPRYNVAEL